MVYLGATLAVGLADQAVVERAPRNTKTQRRRSLFIVETQNSVKPSDLMQLVSITAKLGSGWYKKGGARLATPPLFTRHGRGCGSSCKELAAGGPMFRRDGF